MSMAIANPEELRRFANALETYIDRIDEETGRVSKIYFSEI